ncbi:MAG: DUF4392 domain-containing protein [Gammaproteobacteria bacterium]|nr:DUF4392 domain-containing protein [Gammaproteobacteria bacterium]
MTSDLLQLSQHIEDILVARNLRGMQQVQPALEPGYCLRAAELLRDKTGYILIGTGFPVVDTFETDGPVGAIALYETLAYLGAKPVIVCGQPIVDAISGKYRTHEIKVGQHNQREAEAEQALAHYAPDAIVAIERPGQAADGGYYNMRGESISARTACFDTFIKQAQCPTVAIGDGGNEIGMGKVSTALQDLNIVPAVTSCDELLVADVSNWGAYGLIAFLSLWHNEDLLARIDPVAILDYLSKRGSVDGVTRINELTEDGLTPTEGMAVIAEIRQAIGFTD